MPGRNLGGYNSTAAPLTVTTDGSGVATFTIPAGRLRRYAGCIPVVVAPTSAGRFACQVTSEPALDADLSTKAGTVTVAVSQSNNIVGTLTQLNSTGLTAAPANVTVRLLPLGV